MDIITIDLDVAEEFGQVVEKFFREKNLEPTQAVVTLEFLKQKICEEHDINGDFEIFNVPTDIQ